MEKTTQNAVAAAIEATSGQRGEDTAILIKYLEDLPRATNCSVNFRPLEERIDLRFAEMKRQTHNNFVDLINADRSSEESEESEEEEEGEEGVDGEDRALFKDKRAGIHVFVFCELYFCYISQN